MQKGNVNSRLISEQIKFYPIGLGQANESFMWTSVSQAEMLPLTAILTRTNEKHITILKVDAEGAEFGALVDFFSQPPPVEQLLVEVHMPQANGNQTHFEHASRARFFEMLESVENQG